MNKLIYVSGGCRSGKSHYAQQRLESLPGKRAYLATCPQIDAEMEQRIVKHQQQRAHKGWETIEAPLDLAGAIEQAHGFDFLLVDCLTLWVNNLLYEAEQQGIILTEEAISHRGVELVNACRKTNQTIIFVSNELGMGLVPADPVSRRYRDCLGRCNQTLATRADEVVFMVSGLPLILKEG
ncbi:adenosylcobinamide kinase /adenosylcobinamide-phosphate guanylyltransferase [Desulfuromusa kysingii]|uniref:Adenosylcobinamide kinase n=1 Tax=Desulfuromusa kysingii TaxID=37625 RepID=A0A1H3X0A9_9BACT|nr:bifunctional adenosylcobinamide kinase/adenosylcobinamide-phosphate guanylyltransferase [Desulfuromusa kysingii]SDZ92885.1 adenosylcobinamide kinase /adenosylcobinamide-phosphate guanylyltransferase [Desulfuromusa kysingii]